MTETLIPDWLGGWWLLPMVPLAIFFAVSSALLERSGPIRLRHWAEEAGGNLRRLYDQPARFEAFRLLVTSAALALPLMAILVVWGLLNQYVQSAWWLALLGVAILTLIVELVNRRLVELHAEDTLRVLTVPLRVVHAVTRPLTWVLKFFVPVAEVGEEEDDDEASEEEIKAFIDVGRKEGILEPEEEKWVSNVVDFGDTQVRSVMTPRVEIRSVAADATLQELARAFLEWKHARLPVHGTSIDRIVGILHIRDLFEAVHSGVETDAATLANPAHYIPESKPLRDLFEELQKLQQQMAIVIDEYGGVAGLVTMEDLVEEIVGEIADEHERPRSLQVRIDDNSWRVRGRTPLEELGEIFALDLHELPYETVSGLICGELGYVPKSGDVMDSHGLFFEIEEADERRITVLTARRAPVEAASEG
ncbi:MAG: hemolysin family protein [Acidobacteriota bacterium]